MDQYVKNAIFRLFRYVIFPMIKKQMKKRKSEKE